MAVNEISTQYVRTFEQNVLHLAQAKYSKLRNTVTARGGPTSSHSFRVMSARAAMTAKTGGGTNAGKRPVTPYANSVFNDRIAIPLPVHTADSYEWDDVVKMVYDPESALTQSMAMQAGRQFDDTIIAAATATAADSLGTGGLTLPAGQQLGGAAIAPSFTLVQSVRETILEKEIDPDEEVFLVVSPNFIVTLLADAKATSTDYVNGRALMQGGMVAGWMGFTWVCSNRLTKALVGPPAQIYGLAYTRDAIGMVVTKEPFVEIAKDPGASFSTTVYMGMELGAVRVQDEKLFRVHYLEGN